MTDQIPNTPIQPVRRSLMDRVSIVWVVPIGALLIALGIAWQAYRDRGPLIEIQFQNAAGIVAEQTGVKYRNVSVGVVESVGFADDLSHVVAHVRLDKQVEHYVDANAAFWIVRPEVSTKGITGLETVLSGVYIEGSWDEHADGIQHHFVGLEDTPIARPDQKGSKILLRTRSGRGLREGSPILFKGLEVGRVGAPRLAGDGISVEADAFVYAPHDQLMTTRSRFWNTSGISFSLGTGGAKVDFESITSLLNGGVSFETVVSGGEPVGEGTLFSVHPNQDDARASLFESSLDDENVQLAVVFEENVTGLSVGAPVTLRGLEIGEVVSLSGRVDAEQFGDERVRLIAILSIGLKHLQLGEETKEGEILDFFTDAVAQGWRARLTKASLLTGGLRIEMVEIPGTPPAEFQRDAEPYPIMPSVPAQVASGGASAEGLLKRVNNLPVEDVLASAIEVMDGVTALVSSDDIRSIPSDVRGAIADIRGLVGNEDLQAFPERLNGISDDFQSLLGQMKDAEGIQKLVDAVEKAGAAASEVGSAFEDVPDLIKQIEAVAAKAEALDLDTLLSEASGLMEGARGLLGDEATKALPERLTVALDGVTTAVDEATSLFVDLNETDAASILSDAVIAAGEAAEDVSAAVEDVPALIEKLDGVAAKAEAIELDVLAEEVTGLVSAAEALIGTETARALPEQLGGTLDEVAAALGELRAGGTVENVNAALASARVAAESVASSSSQLPGLIKRTEAVLREAELALAGLSDSGSLNREARTAMREVSRAADAVRSLARMIERKPNAFVTGK